MTAVQSLPTSSPLSPFVDSADVAFAAFDAAAPPSGPTPIAPAGLAAATPFGPTDTAATSEDADALCVDATEATELVRFELLLVADDVADAAAGPSPCSASVIACEVVTAAGGF